MGQLSLFEGTEPLKIHGKIRLIELFGGIGAQAMSLTRLGVPFEHWRMCEIDKYAVKSYNAVHGTDFVPTDICSLHGADLGITNTDEYTYILTYSFPCQDLSAAGKQAGMARGGETRSGLLWEVERILQECHIKPKILLMENVPRVHCYKFRDDFFRWVQSLTEMGYTSRWADLDAKDFGIPQNRIRTFMVSWLGDYTFEFPQPRELELCLADVMEDEVDEKYYLTDKAVEGLIRQNQNPISRQ